VLEAPTSRSAERQASALVRAWVGRAEGIESMVERVGGVDQVGIEERVESLRKRSIKRESKMWALDLAIRMMDLTTLEGKDTEGKVRAGVVDAIVELTETGQTLIANGLRILETVCESTTQLIANPAAAADPWKRRKMDSLKTLLLGAVEADGKVGVKLNVPERKLQQLIDVLPAMKRPTISKLWSRDDRDPWWAVETILEEREIKALIPKLKEAGGQDIIEYPLNKVIY